MKELSSLLLSALALVLARTVNLAAGQNGTRACPAIACEGPYDPVCGSNGRTYDRECDLHLDECRVEGLIVTSRGLCFSCETTACSGTLDPVCGSDGRTYDNECALVLAKCKGVDVARDYFGECVAAGSSSSSDRLVEINCVTLSCSLRSSDALGPVCGSDGKTYRDDCELRQAMCVNATLKKEYDGACPNATESNGAGSSKSSSSKDLNATVTPGGVTGSPAGSAAAGLHDGSSSRISLLYALVVGSLVYMGF